MYTDEKHLYGELRCEKPLPIKYHIKVENEFFSREKGIIFRNSEIYRKLIDKATGQLLSKDLLKKNHAKVLYDCSTLKIIDME